MVKSSLVKLETRCTVKDTSPTIEYFLDTLLTSRRYRNYNFTWTFLLNCKQNDTIFLGRTLVLTSKAQAINHEEWTNSKVLYIREIYQDK